MPDDVNAEPTEQLSRVIVDSNQEIADRIVSSNKETADRLVASDIERQRTLDQHYQEAMDTAADRFTRQKRWSWTSIALNLLTLLVMAGFAVAFFKYAIVVTTRQ